MKPIIKRETKLIGYCAIIGSIILWIGIAFGLFEETHHYHSTLQRGRGNNASYTANNDGWMTIAFLAPYLLLTTIRISRRISTTVNPSKDT